MRVRVPIVAGPYDGEYALVDADSLSPMALATLYDVTVGDDPDAMPMTDEPYVLGMTEGVPVSRADEAGETYEPTWFVVWAPVVQPQIRAALRQRMDAGPDPERVRAMYEGEGLTLLTDPCEAGEHVWGPWTPTRGGNHTRTCRRCYVGQGSWL